MAFSRNVSGTRLVFVVTALGLITSSVFALFVVRAVAQAPPNPPPVVYTYAVKVVCATDGSVDFAGWANPR